MKHNFLKKPLALLGAALFAVSMFPFAVSADVSAAEDFVGEQGDSGYVITRYIGEDENVVIPAVIEGTPVTEIAERAFEGNSDIVSVEIPSGITKIGYHAFTSDRSLETITIAASVTEIDEGVFHECEALSSIKYEGDEGSWAAVSIGDDNDPFTALTPEYNAVLTEQETAGGNSEETTEENTEEGTAEENTTEETTAESAAGTTGEETAAADTGTVSSAAPAAAPAAEAAEPEPQSTGGTKLKIIFGALVGVAVLDIVYYSAKKPK